MTSVAGYDTNVIAESERRGGALQRSRALSDPVYAGPVGAYLVPHDRRRPIAARAPGQTLEVEGAALLADGRVELVLWDGECDYGTEDTAKILRRFNVPASYPITIAHFIPSPR